MLTATEIRAAIERNRNNAAQLKVRDYPATAACEFERLQDLLCQWAEADAMGIAYPMADALTAARNVLAYYRDDDGTAPATGCKSDLSALRDRAAQVKNIPTPEALAISAQLKPLRKEADKIEKLVTAQTTEPEAVLEKDMPYQNIRAQIAKLEAQRDALKAAKLHATVELSPVPAAKFRKAIEDYAADRIAETAWMRDNYIPVEGNRQERRKAEAEAHRAARIAVQTARAAARVTRAAEVEAARKTEQAAEQATPATTQQEQATPAA